MNNFDIFRFKPFINEALAAKGFKQPTEVQERLIPLIAKGKNIIGQSQTGTGKTHTFLLPLFEKINADKEEVQVVITAPSRELAAQIYEAATQIAKFSTPEIRVSNFVGGTDKQRQLNRLHHQQPQVVVGTPGRILDIKLHVGYQKNCSSQSFLPLFQKNCVHSCENIWRIQSLKKSSRKQLFLKISKIG